MGTLLLISLAMALFFITQCVHAQSANQSTYQTPAGPNLIESLSKLFKPNAETNATFSTDSADAQRGLARRDASTPTTDPTQSAKRVALVIGNSAYQQGRLTNPVNDARSIASRLRNLGFDVITRENLKVREVGGVYREFRSRISPGGVALVFYAGHGLQFKGQNYFPAVDSEINSEEDVPLQSINLGTHA